MSGTERQLDLLKLTPKPWLWVFNWPEPVGVSPDTVRAAIFSGEATKEVYDGLLVRDDERFLEFVKIGMAWRVTSGHFIGEGSKRDSQVVRTDHAGRPVLPRKGLLGILAGNRGAYCTWQEALAVALNFAGLGGMPSGFAWWQGEDSP